MSQPESLYVASFHKRFRGRIAICVGYSEEMVEVFPIVIEDENMKALGIVAMAAMSNEDIASVHFLHFSVFKPRCGNGSKMIVMLCQKADQLGVALSINPIPMPNGRDSQVSSQALIDWYGQYGFRGDTLLIRRPYKPFNLRLINCR